MDREQAKALLPVIQAFAEGKTIQYRLSDKSVWDSLPKNGEMVFTLNPSNYRIKPEPREFELAEYPSGTVYLLTKYWTKEDVTERRVKFIKVREIMED